LHRQHYKGFGVYVKPEFLRDSAVSAIIEERRRWKRKGEEESELGEYFGGKRGSEKGVERSKWKSKTQ
jgi:hypothetical protein